MARLHHPGPRAFNRPSRAALLTALAVSLCSAAPYSIAQPAGRGGPGGPGGSQWGLGIGIVNSQRPYAGMERETKALPLIRFENEYVKVGGLGVQVKLPGIELGESNRIKFGLVGKFDMAGYKAKDAPIVAGMTERKSGFWAGAKAEWDNDLVQVEAEWTADTSGHSKGQKFTLGFEKNLRLGNQLMVVPYLKANWLDKKYVDYYYGVRAAEATAGRAAHVGQGEVNVDAGLRTMVRFDRQHSMLFDVGVTSLAKEIKDSPLVDRSSTNRVVLGYMYSF
jgi:outer membrane protein